MNNKLEIIYDDFLTEDMREAWERPPMWRFLIAQRAMLAPNATRPTMFNDQYIKSITNCMDALRKRFTGRAIQLKQYEAAFTAYRIWNNSTAYCGLRWQVEAYILAGATDEELWSKFPYKAGVAVYEYYRKIFFDIEAYKDNDNLLLTNVLAVAYDNHTDATKSDLLWKRVAMSTDIEGFDNFLKVYIRGTDVNTKEKIKEIQEQNLMMESANITLKGKLINERSLMTLSLAANIMHIPHDTTSDMEKAAIHEKVGAMVARMVPVLIKSKDKIPDNSADIKAVDSIHHIQKERAEKIKEAKKRYQESGE